VHLHGDFLDGNQFKLSIDYKSYVTKFIAPLESLVKLSNFRNIDELEVIED
jgi:hypothetical protein